MPAPAQSSRSLLAARTRIYPAVLATFLAGMTFAGLKFVIIGRIALDWKPDQPGALDSIPWEWLQRVILAAHARGGLEEAISQAMGAMLTLGLLLGYAVNAPLAGAWRCDRLFGFSALAVAIGCIATLWFNPWPWALFIGFAYGAACAARGKVVPLLARATERSNTLVSGVINAALAIGLVCGTIAGGFISQRVGSHLVQHGILVVAGLAAVWLGFRVRVPEPIKRRFFDCAREIGSGTWRLWRGHWPLLLGGGLAWGIASAASLAMFVDAIDRLHVQRDYAGTLAGVGALGAITGNLISHWGNRRRWVIGEFVVWGLLILAYPHVCNNYWQAAIAVFFMGMLFAAPANVLDARFLGNAHDLGHAGLGGTVMSLIHSLFIFVIGGGLAVPLFLGAIAPETQFLLLGVLSILTAIVAAFARLRDREQTPYAPSSPA